jgi:hypothetical protein
MVHGQKPVGVIDILNAVVMLCPDYRNRQNVFRVRVARGATFLFEPVDTDDGKKWVGALQLAASGGLDDRGIVAVDVEGGPSLFGRYAAGVPVAALPANADRCLVQ